jgi:xanthine dehydrogenase YagT iron-sulfur-binding subunit
MSSDRSDGPHFSLHRRAFLTAAATTTAASFIARGARAQSAPPADAVQRDPRTPRPLTLVVNGRTHHLALDPRTSLLDALREHLQMTGTKKGCDHGQCGACTVHLDGKRALSCMTFAAMAEGHQVTTIEGLSAADGALHPMQQAFIDQDAFQCGYCTPGQIMSAVACVAEGHAGSDAEIREFMSGNICRCAAYPNIVAAVKQAKGLMRS